MPNQNAEAIILEDVAQPTWNRAPSLNLHWVLIGLMVAVIQSACSIQDDTDSENRTESVASSFAGLVDAEFVSHEGELSSFEAYEIVYDDGVRVTDVLDAEDGDVELPGSVCECEDNKCREAWVRENMGCNICLDVVCDDGSHSGGCALCDNRF